MKLLVFSNCATQAYVTYLKTAHPNWELRSVIQPQAKIWIEEEHAGFLSYLSEVDLFLGLTDRALLRDRVRPEARRVPLPLFLYLGHQPDVVLVPGLPSPLEHGLAQSRIAMAGWLSGLPAAETQRLFNGAHYARLGYYDARAQELAVLYKHFDRHRLDVRPVMERWLDVPGFLGYPAHPRVGFFFDVARHAMEQAGFPPEVPEATLDAARDGMHDYLRDGLHWPIYPEIAAHHGIAADPPDWRSSAAHGQGKHFDLPEMIARSYAIYDAHPDQRASMETALGGPEAVATYVARD